MQKKIESMLSDQVIIDGFRRGDSSIIKQYFYNYCKVAYCIFDKKYELSKKENLDFMSLAHQYAIYLMEHDWKPLEDHSSKVSLRTWMINGFRYIVLDALRWHKREYGTLTFEDYLKSFDTSQDLRLNFNKTIQELCDSADLDRKSRTIITMLLVNGYKSKEVAEQINLTPSAVSQRFMMLKKSVVIPYFWENFDMDFDMPEVMETTSFNSIRCSEGGDWIFKYLSKKKKLKCHEFSNEISYNTNDYLDRELAPGEIFVFGSNLRGIHCGGAAHVAFQKYGAVMGQGVGLQGRSYAIPTMQGGVETIKPYVNEFIRFAKEHLELTFLVTRIGCDVAGFDDKEIAPLFTEANNMKNIVLPEMWDYWISYK